MKKAAVKPLFLYIHSDFAAADLFAVTVFLQHHGKNNLKIIAADTIFQL